MSVPYRISGAAAVLGGALRVATALVPDPFDLPLWPLYLVIDVLLLIGWAGIYFRLAAAAGMFGAAVALLGAAALTVLLARDILHLDVEVAGISLYLLGAGLLVVAAALMGIAIWRARIFPQWIAYLWLGAVVFGLLSQILEEHAPMAFQFAGIAFGLGFVGAGITLLFGAPHRG
jgi:hypothetical protein